MKSSTRSRPAQRQRAASNTSLTDFALVVGVDRYAPGANLYPLQGCANDARALQRLLRTRLAIPEARVVALIDEGATRDAFDSALEQLIAAASSIVPDDASRPHLWVTFSGYGSRALRADRHLAPSLVLHDSRSHGGCDLLLAGLLARLDAAPIDVTLLLDCGHRAHGGQRAIDTLRHEPVVRAFAPSLRPVRPLRPLATSTVPASGDSQLTVVTGGGANALVHESPVRDLEGSLWRGALTLAVEEYLSTCPTLRNGQDDGAPEQALGKRVAAMGLAQRPQVWGSDAFLVRAREQAAATAAPLRVDAEEAGLYWVDGGRLQGLAPGCRLQSCDANGRPLATLEVVEVGIERSGCAPLEVEAALDLPASVVAIPTAGETFARQSATQRSTPSMRLLSARLATGHGAVTLSIDDANSAARRRRADSAAQALLAAFDDAPLPEGMEAWPDAFTPVFPPGEESGPVCLSLDLEGDVRHRSPGSPLRLEFTLEAPVAAPSPAALVALVRDEHGFLPFGRAHLSPPPPGAAAEPFTRLRRAISQRLHPNAPDATPAQDHPHEHRVTIDLQALPGSADTESTARVSQSVGRTLKIYLYAVAAREEATLGLFQVRFVPGAWAAHASAASFSKQVSGGELRYTPALPSRQGERVALLLHGFADDSAQEAHWTLNALRDEGIVYDRVLTFEYESLRTSVEQNAHSLRNALHSLGFLPDEGSAPPAMVDLFGHSMGALIGRCLVERMGGDLAIDRCVFFGSPNEGTPLASAALLAPWLLALGINVARPALPSLVVAWALGTVAIDVQGPADLRPGAPLLSALSARDRAVRTRYLLIAGDLSLAPQRSDVASAETAPVADDAQEGRWLETVAGGADELLRLFYGGANDLAVSVRSALQVSAGRMPGSTVRCAVVPTHHLGYFSSPLVTQQVAQWLADDEPPVG